MPKRSSGTTDCDITLKQWFGTPNSTGAYPLEDTQPGEVRLPSQYVRHGHECAPALTRKNECSIYMGHMAV